MRYEKGTIEYELNMDAFHWMDECAPMTKRERDSLRRWARYGNDIDENPWNLTDDHGCPLNYLQAFRMKKGYSSGPWDYWKGSEDFLKSDLASRSLFLIGE